MFKNIIHLGSNKFRHVDRIDSIRVSEDGKWLVSSSWDYSVVIWNINSGLKLKTFRGHTGYIHFADFIFNDTAILSCSEDGTIRFWSISDENLNWSLNLCNSAITNFDVYGDFALVCCMNNCIYKVNLLNAEIENFVLEHQSSKEIIGISLDHRWTIHQYSKEIFVLFETDSPEIVYAKVSKPEIVGRLSDRFYVKFKKKKCWFQSLSSELFCVKYSFIEKKIYSSGRDCGIRIWDSEKQFCIKHVGENYGLIRNLIIDEKTKQILAVNDEGQLIIFTISGEFFRLVKISDKPLLNIELTPHGIILVGEDTNIYLLDNNNNKHVLKGHFWHVTYANWMPSLNLLATASKDYTIRIWDIVKKVEVTHYDDAPVDYIDAVIFLIVNNKLITVGGSEDGTVRLWGLNGKNEILIKMPGQIHCFNKDINSEFAIIGDSIGNLSIYDIKHQRIILNEKDTTSRSGWIHLSITHKKNLLNCFGISTSGEFIKLIYSLTGNLIQEVIISDQLGILKSANYNIKSKLLICGDLDGGTYYYRYSDIRQCLNIISSDNLHDGEWITAICQSSYLKAVATGCWSRIILYRKDNGENIELKGHTDTIRSLIFSSDNKYLISSSWDQTIRFWCTKTYEQILCIKNNGRGVCLDSIIYNNHLYLAVGNVNTTISVYKILS